MSLSFHTFNRDTRQFYPAAGAVESYPGGDIAVRHLQPAPAGSVPVAWNAGGTLDYAALAQWVAFHAAVSGIAAPILVMPYLPSARGDHDPTADAQVSARLTAATGIGHVICADPHSPIWAEHTGWDTAVHTITAADLIGGSTLMGAHWEWDAVIAPDKGAVDRAGAVARVLGVPLLTAGKARDAATGKLSGFTAPDGIGAGRFLVVDDICDGGGTFAGLAQVIAAAAPKAELHLWITHGLFTGRWRENLATHYVSITAADTTAPSEPAALPPEVRAVPLLPAVLDALTHFAAPVAAH